MELVTKQIFDLRSVIVRILRLAQIDRPVFFGLADKIWLITTGPVTLILIATRFTPELQGYYYTFANLLALQVFVEMGLGTVIIQFASHEWSKLSLDEEGGIVGDTDALSRLSSLAQIATKWYLIGGILLSLGLALGGYIFFSTSNNTAGISWSGPWVLLSLMTGTNIVLLPLWSILEGCNQVSKLYAYRFIQDIFKNIFLWIAIFGGAQLWSTSVSILVIIVCAPIFILSHYKKFFIQLLRSKPESSVIKWKEDLLPMQWRIALSWMSGYFVFSLFTPVLFKYQGPVVAGQMGMTLSVVSVVSAIACAWLAPKVPVFGMLIAQSKYDDLDKLMWRIVKIVMIVSTIIVLVIWSTVFLLYHFHVSLSNRILPPAPTLAFLFAQVLIVFSFPMSAYLRAHKREPLVMLSLISGLLIGSSTIVLGKYYSVSGVAMGYLAVNSVVILCVFLIWKRCKNQWHVIPCAVS